LSFNDLKTQLGLIKERMNVQITPKDVLMIAMDIYPNDEKQRNNPIAKCVLQNIETIYQHPSFEKDRKSMDVKTIYEAMMRTINGQESSQLRG
jgi:hypothetical protein